MLIFVRTIFLACALLYRAKRGEFFVIIGIGNGFWYLYGEDIRNSLSAATRAPEGGWVILSPSNFKNRISSAAPRAPQGGWVVLFIPRRITGIAGIGWRVKYDLPPLLCFAPASIALEMLQLKCWG